MISTSALTAGALAGLDVTANAACTLSGFIDFTRDGDWADAGEDLFPGGLALTAGLNAITFPVPAAAPPGTTSARFRCTTTGKVGVTGVAPDGEVEDYQVTVGAKAVPTVAITAHTPEPSAPGQPVSVSFTVSSGGAQPTGTVTVIDGEGHTCQATVAAGSCNVTLTTIGAKTLTATYAGDFNFTGAAGAATHTVATITVAIDGLADGAAITPTSPFLDLSGSAAARPFRARADAAATVTSVTWVNDRGGSGAAEGTATWRIRNIPLQPGANRITVTVSDTSGATAAATITATVTQLLYYLAEGATGPFFDFDLVLGNPNGVPAPVTVTFLKEDGSTTVHTETLTANAQRTLRVNDLPGLASVAVSTVVSSDSGLPLSVERSMLWDASVPAPRPVGPSIAPGATHYGGHTAKAVDSPRTTWLFAEGSQGFFDTYLLLANANPNPTPATVTYLLEGGAPIVQNVTVLATSRLTLFAGALPGLVGKSFGISVTSTLPIIAERAMYFSTSTFWEGGHESAGVPEAATSWFLRRARPAASSTRSSWPATPMRSWRT